MVTRRTAKTKGYQMEYSVFDSLLPIMPIKLTKELGYAKQYDLICDEHKIVIEVKRHKGFNWNELIKFFNKLQSVKPEGYTPLLIFKPNRQPCLIMRQLEGWKHPIICRFEDYFKTTFIEHNHDTRR